MSAIEILSHTGAIAVCIKPPGVCSEDTAAAPGMPTLLARQFAEHQPSPKAPAPLFAVHRLDQTTGGVMVYACTRAAAAKLSAAIQRGAFHKTYLVAVGGEMEEPAGEMTDELFFDGARRMAFPVSRPRAGSKRAHLTYEVLACLPSPWQAEEKISLCRVCPTTGRTHQIRAQFAARRHPLLGDGKYGSRTGRCGCALWCAALSFPDPETGETRTFAASPTPETAFRFFPSVCAE